MITTIEINGFKSFQNFQMEFSPLTVIAGVNATGKSNLFDALQLLSRLAETDIKTAFGEQRGDASELFTQYGENWYADEIYLAVEMLVNRKIKDNWGGETYLKYARLRYELKIKRSKKPNGYMDDLLVIHEHLETIKHHDDNWVKKHIHKDYLDYWRPKVETGKRGKPYITTEDKNGIPTIKLSQDGKADEQDISVWLSKMTTLITEINSKKLKLKITKMFSVIKEGQVPIPFSEQKEQERKLTLSDVAELLETSDFENTRQALLN